MTTEPHLVIFVGDCPVCWAENVFQTVTIPKLATGEHFPMFGLCSECESHLDLKGSPPITRDEETGPCQSDPG